MPCNRKLYTLAYPALTEADTTFIARFRDERDVRYRDVVAPHFTMVFASDAGDEGAYLRHIQTVAERSHAIGFSCRYAMLGADDQDETAYVFLVPDEGYSRLSLLHDKLHTGVLSTYLRLAIPFTPHIAIGTLADRRIAKQLCDDLNDAGLSIHGSVQALTVGALAHGRISNLASFRLRA